MKNILIPTDFSENSWNAIEYALHFFGKTPCNFYLLHVYREDAFVPLSQENFSNQSVASKLDVKPTKSQLQNLVKRIQKKFPKNTNHRFFTILDHNYFINSIREQVLQKKINLIVMGTKGASGLKKIAIGSNTGNVITKVKCTTLVVPENAKYAEPKGIAFPTDFSIFYRPETLQPILDILEASKATVNVLHFNRNKAQLNEDQLKNKEYLDGYFGSNSHSFHFLTSNQIEEAIQQFVDENNVDLIAMLAKNLNYFQKILFQPSSKAISYYKDIPFLVLH